MKMQYPKITLAQARNCCEQLLGFAGASVMDRNDLLGRLGYSDTSGRGSIVISAMRQYGLINIRKKQYSLSDLALSLVNEAGQPTGKAVRKRSFLYVFLFRELYEEIGERSLSAADRQILRKYTGSDAKIDEVFSVYNSNLQFMSSNTEVWHQSELYRMKENEPDQNMLAHSLAPLSDVWGVQNVSPTSDRNEYLDELKTYVNSEQFMEYLLQNWNAVMPDYDLNVNDVVSDHQGISEPTNRIDILARNKKDKSWLVVELKKNLNADQAVGRLLRLMNYVRSSFANKDDKVKGLLVVENGSGVDIKELNSVAPDIAVMSYSVNFEVDAQLS